MCSCPEVVGCHLCGSLERLYHYQGIELCEECLLSSSRR